MALHSAAPSAKRRAACRKPTALCVARVYVTYIGVVGAVAGMLFLTGAHRSIMKPQLYELEVHAGATLSVARDELHSRTLHALLASDDVGHTSPPSHCVVDNSTFANCGDGTCTQAFEDRPPACECNKCWRSEVTQGRPYARCTSPDHGGWVTLLVLASVPVTGVLGINLCVMASWTGKCYLACLGIIKACTVGGLLGWYIADIVTMANHKSYGMHFC